MKKISKEELLGMKKQELLTYCKNNNIKVYSNKNKAYITNLILNFYKSGNKPVKKKSIEYTKNQLESIEDYKKYLNKNYTDPGFKKKMLSEYKKDKKNIEVKKPIKKSSGRLKLFIYGSNIRKNGIGDVDYIIVTTSKRNAILRVQKVDLKHPSTKLMEQRTNTFPEYNIFPKYYKKIKGFSPWNTPEILYMIETDKIFSGKISSRATPKILKKWDKSNRLIFIKKIRVEDNFDKFYDKYDAKITGFDVWVDDDNEYKLDILVERALKAGFVGKRTHNLTEIEHKNYGYQQNFKLKKPRPVSLSLVKKIERVVNPIRKDIFSSSIKYEMKYKGNIYIPFFYGTTVERVEKQIKKYLLEGYSIW